jgi:hypothetical protein
VTVTPSIVVEKSVVVPISVVVTSWVLMSVEVWTTVVCIVLVMRGVVTRQLHAVEMTDSA